MQDREREIDAEYDLRLGELVEWRMRELAKLRAPPEEEEEEAARFAVGTNQFHVEYGMNACTAAATAAVLYVLSYIASEEGVAARDVMPNLPWGTIVETGARLWCEYAASPDGRLNPSGHVEFDQLLACGGTFCATVQRALEVIVEIAGHTDDAVVEAMDAGALPKTLCETVEAIPPRAAAVVTATSIDVHGDGHGVGARAAAGARGHNVVGSDNNNSGTGEDVEMEGTGVTLAVLRIADEYWVYDSHGAGDTETAALLCRCTTAGAAATVLKEQLPVGLYCATVVKRRRGRARPE